MAKKTNGRTPYKGNEAQRDGYMNFGNIMGNFFGNKPTADDDEGRMFKNVMAMDFMSKFFDTMNSRNMGQYQSGLSKDMMNHAFNLEQMGLSNSRKEEFSYGMRAMDKTYELQNQFANQQYGRDIGMLGATGEQTRKNYAAQGVQNRLQTITEGEQARLNYAAQGDQDRRSRRVQGEEDRKGYRVQGEETRANTITAGIMDQKSRQVQGAEDRKGYRVQGDEDRKSRITQGQQDRLGYRVQGDEDRKSRVTQGQQDRLTEVTRGEQERLNIGARGDEDRKSYDFNDKIDARREARAASRARGAARAF